MDFNAIYQDIKTNANTVWQWVRADHHRLGAVVGLGGGAALLAFMWVLYALLSVTGFWSIVVGLAASTGLGAYYGPAFFNGELFK